MKEGDNKQILLTIVRDQDEAYGYGLPNITIQDYTSLKTALNQGLETQS